MDEVLAQLSQACVGMAPEDIEAQIMASQNVSAIPDSAVLSRFLAAAASAGGDVTQISPDQAEEVVQTGND